eukprot:10796871-Alexandrium_andersonii.AAC.1
MQLAALRRQAARWQCAGRAQRTTRNPPLETAEARPRYAESGRTAGAALAKVGGVASGTPKSFS